MAGLPSLIPLPTDLPPLFPTSNPSQGRATSPFFQPPNDPTSTVQPASSSPDPLFPPLFTQLFPPRTTTTPTTTSTPPLSSLLPQTPIDALPTTPSTPPPPVIVTVTTFPPTSASSSTASLAAAGAPTSTSFFNNKPVVTGVFTTVGLCLTALLVALITVTVRRRRAQQRDREISEAAAFAQPRMPFDDDLEDAKFGRTRTSASGASHSSQTHASAPGAPPVMYQQGLYQAQPSVYAQTNASSVSQPSADYGYSRSVYSNAGVAGVGAGMNSGRGMPSNGVMYDRGGYNQGSPRMPYGAPPVPSPYGNNMAPVRVPGGPEPDIYQYNSAAAVAAAAGLPAAHIDSHHYPSFRGGPGLQPSAGMSSDFHPVSPNRRSTGASSHSLAGSTSMPSMTTAPLSSNSNGMPMGAGDGRTQQPGRQDSSSATSMSGGSEPGGVPAALRPGVKKLSQGSLGTTEPDSVNAVMTAIAQKPAPGVQDAPRQRQGVPIRSNSAATVGIRDDQDYAMGRDLKVVNG